MAVANRKELHRSLSLIAAGDRFRATVAGLAFPEECRVEKANPAECQEEKAERAMARTMEGNVLRLRLNFLSSQAGWEKRAAL